MNTSNFKDNEKFTIKQLNCSNYLNNADDKDNTINNLENNFNSINSNNVSVIDNDLEEFYENKQKLIQEKLYNNKTITNVNLNKNISVEKSNKYNISTNENRTVNKEELRSYSSKKLYNYNNVEDNCKIKNNNKKLSISKTTKNKDPSKITGCNLLNNNNKNTTNDRVVRLKINKNKIQEVDNSVSSSITNNSSITKDICNNSKLAETKINKNSLINHNQHNNDNLNAVSSKNCNYSRSNSYSKKTSNNIKYQIDKKSIKYNVKNNKIPKSNINSNNNKDLSISNLKNKDFINKEKNDNNVFIKSFYNKTNNSMSKSKKNINDSKSSNQNKLDFNNKNLKMPIETLKNSDLKKLSIVDNNETNKDLVNLSDNNFDKCSNISDINNYTIKFVTNSKFSHNNINNKYSKDTYSINNKDNNNVYNKASLLENDNLIEKDSKIKLKNSFNNLNKISDILNNFNNTINISSNRKSSKTINIVNTVDNNNESKDFINNNLNILDSKNEDSLAKKHVSKGFSNKELKDMYDKRLQESIASKKASYKNLNTSYTNKSENNNIQQILTLGDINNITNYSSSNNKNNIDTRSRIFYNRNLNWIKNKEDKLNLIRKTKKDNEVLECIFNPKISKSSEKLLINSNKYNKNNSIFDRNMHWKRNVSKNIQNKHLIQERKLFEECLFEPQLFNKPIKTMNSLRDNYNNNSNIIRYNTNSTRSNNINKYLMYSNCNLLTSESKIHQDDYMYNKTMEWKQRIEINRRKKELENDEKRMKDFTKYINKNKNNNKLFINKNFIKKTINSNDYSQKNKVLDIIKDNKELIKKEMEEMDILINSLRNTIDKNNILIKKVDSNNNNDNNECLEFKVSTVKNNNNSIIYNSNIKACTTSPKRDFIIQKCTSKVNLIDCINKNNKEINYLELTDISPLKNNTCNTSIN